jgi:hypothetical protein
MKPTREISRRSFLGRLSGGAAATGALVLLTGCAGFGYSDSDPYDPFGGGGGGGGRGNGRRRRDDDDDRGGRGRRRRRDD